MTNSTVPSFRFPTTSTVSEFWMGGHSGFGKSPLLRLNGHISNNLQATLRQYVAHQIMAFHACEAHIQSLHPVCQAAVVDAEAMEDGGIERMDVDAVLD